MAEEKLTQKATAVLQDAQQSAAMNYHQEVTSRHVFHALLKDRDSIVDHILAQAKIEPSLLETKAAQLVKSQPSVKGQEGNLRWNTAMVRVMALAEKLAKDAQDEYVSVEHLLMAVAEDGDGDVVQVCRDFGLSRSKIRDWSREFRKGQNVTSDNPEGGAQILAKYGRDLTELAKQGKLDPVIGRDDGGRPALAGRRRPRQAGQRPGGRGAHRGG